MIPLSERASRSPAATPPRRARRRRLTATGAFLALAAALAGALVLLPGGRSLALALVKAGIRREFADVRAISPRELAARLAGAERSPPGLWLLDVREPAEFNASHLPGARPFPPGSGFDKLPAGLPKDAPVIVYCSVGYRSAVAARRLRAAGFTDVRNLEGSIFQWANENRPLADAAGAPAERVHPFSPTWGLLLRPERRAEVR